MPFKLRDLNDHLVCNLCGGYFIDATTIIECLHSFCRSCIVSYLATNKCCPRCEIPAHKTRPLLNIRSDKTLQDVVYKIVPNLYDNEKERKKKFHAETGIPVDADETSTSSVGVSPEKTEHRVSLSLDYDTRELALAETSLWKKESLSFPKRYLRCFDSVSISTIHKFVRKKLCRDDLEVITYCRGEVLPETYTLMDVAKTFSWKSDRPLCLTYMTFTPKGRKRKILETIENEMEKTEETPAKKMAKISEPSPQKTPTPFVTSTSLADSKQSNDNVKSPLHTGYSPHPVEARPTPPTPVRAVLPKPVVTQTTRPQTTSQNGSKNMSYSVMNVPLREAVAAPVAGARNLVGKAQPVSRNFGPTLGQNNVNGIASTSSFVPQQAQGPERSKSINSIANRLQIQRQRQHEHVTPETTIQDGVNLPDVLKAATQPPTKPPSQPRSAWTPTDAASNAKMQRNLMARRVNASTLENQRRDGSPDARALQALLPGTNGAQNAVSKHGKPLLSPTSSQQGNFIQLQRNSEPPNYTQTTEQQRKLILMRQQQQQQQLRQQQQQQMRPKYPEIQPKVPVRLDGRQPLQSQPTRPQKHSSIEDSQLLSTTRQLASLRQQQKLLNEIAAAVRGRGTNLRTNESLRAAVSRMTSPARMPTTSRPTHTNNNVPSPRMRMQSPSSTQQRFSATSPNKGPQAPQNRSREMSNPTRFIRPNGTSFSEVSTRMPQSIGYPMLNNLREGGVDIYQNTIAKAKAEVREMSMKDRLPQHRAQIRSSVVPYNVHRPSMGPRKIQSRPTFARTPYASPHPVPIAPKPTLNNSHTPRMSPASSYRGLTTRPPPPPPKMLSPVGSVPFRPHRPVFSPPPPTSQPRLSHMRPPVTLPEQDQPLCLVVKK